MMQDFKNIEKLIKYVQQLSSDPLHQRTLLNNAASYIDSMVQEESHRQVLGKVLDKIQGD